jgi:hypothetical protein
MISLCYSAFLAKDCISSFSHEELISQLKTTSEVIVPADSSTSEINSKCRKGRPPPTGAKLERSLTVVFGAFGRVHKDQKPKFIDVAHITSILCSVQLTGILEPRFASQVEFHVVVSCGSRWGVAPPVGEIDCSEFARQATLAVKDSANAHIHVFHGNAFEYPALHWLWQLACSSPERLFLYFHSKGTRYHQNGK